MNRRDLMKWFGAGCVAVPIIGGMPKPEAAAIIVHQPVIEVPPPPKIHTEDALNELGDLFMGREICEVSVYIKQKGSPRTIRIKCDAYLDKFSMSSKSSVIDVTKFDDQFRQFATVLVSTSFQCTGEPELIEGGFAR